MTHNRGDKVRINTPDEADHGAIVEVIGMHSSPYSHNEEVWVMMPFGYAWLYKLHEVESVVEVPAEPEKEKEWWEDQDTSKMDYLDYGAFEDAMTPEEYQRYNNKEGE